jgi:hypothetical protein
VKESESGGMEEKYWQNCILSEKRKIVFAFKVLGRSAFLLLAGMHLSEGKALGSEGNIVMLPSPSTCTSYRTDRALRLQNDEQSANCS